MLTGERVVLRPITLEEHTARYAWVEGAYEDMVLMSVLRSEWLG